MAWPFGELTVITAHLSRDSRLVRDPTKAAADAVRIGIHRFLRNLVVRGDMAVSPLRVRQALRSIMGATCWRYAVTRPPEPGRREAS